MNSLVSNRCNAILQLNNGPHLSDWISAVDVPEAQDKLARGEVSFSTVATLQKFVRNEKKYKSEIYTPDQKKELFAMAVGKSRCETEVELAKISPQSVPRREEILPMNASENKMTLIITDELLKKIDRLKEVLPEGHGNTIADVLDKSVSIALRKFDPLLKREAKEREKPQSQHQPQPTPQPQPKSPTSSNESRSKKAPLHSSLGHQRVRALEEYGEFKMHRYLARA